MPETEPTPAAEPQPANPMRKQRQCRYIKTSGEQCRAQAMTGNHYCYSHKYNRRPTFTGVKGYDRVAFLEDAASIQLALSQTMQGLLDRDLDHNTARAVFYGCAVASGLVRLDFVRERWLTENKQPIPGQVTETSKSEDSEPLAPEHEYRGPSGVFEPQWSFSKYLYEQQCEEMGQPKPTCAADFPASGWLTDDEVAEDPEDFAKRYRTRKLKLSEQAQAAKATPASAADSVPNSAAGSAQNHPEPSTAQPEQIIETSAQQPMQSGIEAQPAAEAQSLNTHPQTEVAIPPAAGAAAYEGPVSSIARHSASSSNLQDHTGHSNTESRVHASGRRCRCGGLYGGDPCNDCLDRQQRNASPAQDRSANSASLDLKASAEQHHSEPGALSPEPRSKPCSEPRSEPCSIPGARCPAPCPIPTCAPMANRPSAKDCSLLPVPCSLSSQVPNQKGYPPTPSKQCPSPTCPSPRNFSASRRNWNLPILRFLESALTHRREFDLPQYLRRSSVLDK